MARRTLQRTSRSAVNSKHALGAINSLCAALAAVFPDLLSTIKWEGIPDHPCTGGDNVQAVSVMGYIVYADHITLGNVIVEQGNEVYEEDGPNEIEYTRLTSTPAHFLPTWIIMDYTQEQVFLALHEHNEKELLEVREEHGF